MMKLTKTINGGRALGVDEWATVAWSVDGSCIAVAGKDGIMVIENDTWEVLYTLSSKPISHMTWSKDHLFASSGDLISVWDKRGKTVVSKHKANGNVVGMCISNSDLVFLDATGDLHQVANALPKKSTKQLDSLFEKEDEVEKEDESESDFVEDDDGAGYAEYGYDAPVKSKAPKSRLYGSLDVDGLVSKYETAPRAVSRVGQESFQPGATPLNSGSTRYLSFTTLGVIYSVDQGISSTVHVEFHDGAGPIRNFQLANAYTLGHLGSRGAVFASESHGTEPASVYYRPFNPWATKSDWIMQLDPLENVKGVGMYGAGVVVLTDLYVRFFSFGGFQTHVFSLAGSPISIVGGDDRVFVVFKTESGLGYWIWNDGAVSEGSIAINPGARLEWIGFSETGVSFF
jgi:chromosome transmission fidelity protein 4